MSQEKEKFPETLYVVEEPVIYSFSYRDAYKHLVGKRAIENAVPDNGKENVVAIYKLVSVSRYQKKVTRTEIVEIIEKGARHGDKKE